MSLVSHYTNSHRGLSITVVGHSMVKQQSNKKEQQLTNNTKHMNDKQTYINDNQLISDTARQLRAGGPTTPRRQQRAVQAGGG